MSQFGKIPEAKDEKALDTIREHEAHNEGNIFGVSKSSIPKSNKQSKESILMEGASKINLEEDTDSDG